MIIDNDIFTKAQYIGNYLNMYLSKNQGVLLGEHTVISHKVHMTMPKEKIKGRVKILINRDAGVIYQGLKTPDQVIHLDTYHLQGEINFPQLLLEIFSAVEQYFTMDNKEFHYSEEKNLKEVLELCRKIYISCNAGQGNLYNLLQKGINSEENEEKEKHVHILVNIEPAQYAFLYVIALAVEEALLQDNIKLAHITKIFHEKQKRKDNYDQGNYLKLPWRHINGATILDMNNQMINQLLLTLAEKFGGLEELEDFLNAYAKGKNKRMSTAQRNLVQPYLAEMVDMQIIKKHLWGMRLTKEGEKLRKHLARRRCELQMEIRRNLRRIPAGSKKMLRGQKKPTARLDNTQHINYSRTVYSPHSKWEGNLAVPQTIVQAKINNLMRREDKLTIRKTDLHRYANKSTTPVNICLLLDCSASMTGRKKNTATYVAEHLLLSGKDKVAIVIFQERSGRVVVPFTRQENLLRQGLATIKPTGLTPMAQGIDTACQLIKKSRVKNPLLVLITDGLPNVAFWTRNPEADTLKAAEKIKEIKGKFICVGVESNHEFLNRICEQVKGTFYLTEDFNREELINIIRYERKNIINNKSKMRL